MKIDLNDPRITAFALGELKGNDAIEIARAVRTDTRVRAAVDEVRDTSCMLMETLGGNETHLLTSEQRDAVRGAGSSSVITDISSAKQSFWTNPAVAGIGVAAAVALTLYIVAGRSGSGSGPGGDDLPAKWDWAQVDMDSLMAPAVSDVPGDVGSTNGAKENAHAVSAAISDDTHSFRKEVKQRIESMKEEQIESAASLPELEDSSKQRWQNITGDHPLNVPLASGAASWPWIVRSIEEQKKLPPQRAVRIEEMVNHFRYKKPTMISGGGLVADMEICRTPWNPTTVLLAVHVSADSASQSVNAPAILSINATRVQRVRLMGYAQPKNTPTNDRVGRPSHASRSHGNYVIYELEMRENEGSINNGAIATLSLGKGANTAQLPVGRISGWIHASADLRFASAVSACGMLLNGSQAAGELDAKRLLSLVDIIEKQDLTALGGERRGALKIIRQAAGLVDATSSN